MQMNQLVEQVSGHIENDKVEGTTPFELDIAALQSVAGGLAPNSTWGAEPNGTTSAPNSTW